MPLITKAQTRKDQRKQERKKRKQHHGRQNQVPAVEEEHEDPEPVPKLKKIKKEDSKKSKETKDKKNDPYGDVDPDLAAAMLRDDEEIEDLAMKLGVKKNKKGKDKLNKEYARLEGYGDDFGDFLEDLDHMVRRVTKPGGEDYSEESKAAEPKEKEKKRSKKNGISTNMDPDMVAAFERDDAEIAELEQKMGLGKAKEKAKLYKEYAKLEGYGDDFGEFLDDLDDMCVRVIDPRNDSKYSKKLEDQTDNDENMNDESEGSDGEEVVPMKDPYEALDEDDSVLDELEGDELIEREEEEESVEGDDEELETMGRDNAMEEDEETSESDATEHHADDEENEKVGSSSASESAGADSDEDQDSDEEEPDHDVADTYQPSKGEDIYGNTIDTDGADGTKPTKYVPPHLRKRESTDDKDHQERLQQIKRGLNNALNRLSDDTLISVAQQVAKLYSSNPTQMVHEMMWKNTKDACVAPPMLMTGLIPVYIASIVGVHMQTGDTVQLGEYVFESVVTELWKELEDSRQQNSDEGGRENEPVEIEKRRICNLMLILCCLYNYNIVHCSFMYDIVRHLIENFSEVDIECLLLLLSHCGRSLRSDDPLALKEIVLLVQKKKAETSKLASSSRAEYMVSAIMDLKNNKKRNQDTVHTEKIAKIKKLLGRIKSVSAKSNTAKTPSEASLRISLKDMLNADSKGRWWKVGASWIGNQYRLTDGTNDSKEHDGTDGRESFAKDPDQDEELLRLASKFRMNTDRKRGIFCILMGGSDCEDVFEKLCRSSMLQNRSERDTVRVLLECCGNEKSYNKFYGHLADRICEYQPQCKFSLQLAYWDAFKQFESMDTRKAANLAKLLFHLVVSHRTVKLTAVLKALDISPDGDMEEMAMIFLTILLSSILDHFDEPSQVKALFESHLSKNADPGKVEQEEGARASLLVFFLETLKSSPKNTKGSKFRKNFKAVVKELDTDGFEGMF
jgi:nucleolar MIF4G domain-containing protein 1